MRRNERSPEFNALWTRTLYKARLREMIADLKAGREDIVDLAVEYVIAESFGIWHNRARAKICRYFKNHLPSTQQQNSLLTAVVNRLIEGRFGQQFHDQLSMAIRIDPVRMKLACMKALDSEKDYIRRYAKWALIRIESIEKTARIG